MTSPRRALHVGSGGGAAAFQKAAPEVGAGARRWRPDPALSLFLGLYLLILAFFILLFSLSTIEEEKARAVLGSLSSTFGDAPPAAASLGIGSGSGSGDTFRLVEHDVTAALESLVRVAEVDVIKPGRLLRVTLPIAVVFAPGAEAPRRSLYPLLDRIVATLSSPPPGLRVELEFAVSPDGGPAAEAQAARRADAFAREMLARGSPPSRISIALAPRAADKAWLTFRVVAGGSTGPAGTGLAP